MILADSSCSSLIHFFLFISIHLWISIFPLCMNWMKPSTSPKIRTWIRRFYFFVPDKLEPWLSWSPSHPYSVFVSYRKAPPLYSPYLGRSPRSILVYINFTPFHHPLRKLGIKTFEAIGTVQERNRDNLDGYWTNVLNSKFVLSPPGECPVEIIHLFLFTCSLRTTERAFHHRSWRRLPSHVGVRAAGRHPHRQELDPGPAVRAGSHVRAKELGKQSRWETILDLSCLHYEQTDGPGPVLVRRHQLL